MASTAPGRLVRAPPASPCQRPRAPQARRAHQRGQARRRVHPAARLRRARRGCARARGYYAHNASLAARARTRMRGAVLVAAPARRVPTRQPHPRPCPRGALQTGTARPSPTTGPTTSPRWWSRAGRPTQRTAPPWTPCTRCARAAPPAHALAAPAHALAGTVAQAREPTPARPRRACPLQRARRPHAQALAELTKDRKSLRALEAEQPRASVGRDPNPCGCAIC